MTFRLIIITAMFTVKSLLAQEVTYWAGNHETGNHSKALIKQKYNMIAEGQLDDFINETIKNTLIEYPKFHLKSSEIVEFKNELEKSYKYIFSFSEESVKVGLINENPVIMLREGRSGAVAAIVNGQNFTENLNPPIEIRKAIFVGAELVRHSFIDVDYGLPAVLCQELGHHQGRIRTNKVTDLNLEFSVEGS